MRFPPSCPPHRDSERCAISDYHRSMAVHSVTVRDASESDVPGILAIYNDVIATSTAVYRDEHRIRLTGARPEPLKTIVKRGGVVAVDDSGILGFASYG